MADLVFDKYSKFSAPRLIELGFPDEQAVFLSQIGLPKWCAPNMSFGEVFELGEQLPVLESDAKKYVGIGQDRDDNFIAVDLDKHAVWSLVKDSPPKFVASSVMLLSISLREFQTCVDAAVENDRQCFIESRVQFEYLKPFVRWARSTEPTILEPDSFWSSVLCWVGGPNNSFKADGFAAA